MISEGEKWARIVIFMIVGAYTFVVLFLTIRFLIRTCCSPQEDDEASRWQTIIADEEEGRIGHRETESPPPPFLAALKCPLPRTKSLIEDSPPPSYEDVCTIPVPVLSTEGVKGPKPAQGTCQCQCQSQSRSLTNSGIFGSFDFEGVTVVHL